MFGNLSELPDSLFEFFSGNDLPSKQHEAMMLLTVTEDLWPHSAMVSVGEIVAVDRQHLRIMMWPGTTTTTNLLRTGRATLVVVHGGKVYYAWLSVEALPQRQTANNNLTRFSATIEGIREDVAKYADIMSGVQIQLKDQDDVLTRWKRTVEDALID
ncbi:pyridoxamine 5'-phosphate oxidase family protein [Alicyclobacillus dauci]|uniref:Pyridoxamine 5'-phosphate oxidase family protein n=1 Tax=Alicyclobacillus dauci TaxID=1475485 RepID=A0ABY6Z3I3_9BACL|nr:pyridoxamine 5'-phosphate oxidase family protein [Alicyclobacillus dauci]WAH37083.1 pyridoxamine 5'-phosphate oxidase family protein [Alicyclobacillus dauci]